jgi:hypothetical protein
MGLFNRKAKPAETTPSAPTEVAAMARSIHVMPFFCAKPMVGFIPEKFMTTSALVQWMATKVEVTDLPDHFLKLAEIAKDWPHAALAIHDYLAFWKRFASAIDAVMTSEPIKQHCALPLRYLSKEMCAVLVKAGEGETVSGNELLQMRREVYDALCNGLYLDNDDWDKLIKMYEGILADMRPVAEAKGPGALAAFDKATTFSNARLQIILNARARLAELAEMKT